MSIGVVTDSASDLPRALAVASSIVVVPLEVRLGDATPDTLANIDGDAFWALQRTTDVPAETAAPSPGQFAEAFQSHPRGGADGVVCVTISSRLSATYQAALTGAGTISDIPIVVVDSQSATMGEGIVALEAADAASSGAALDDVVDRAQRAVERTRVMGTLDTLENLRRGGRIGTAQAFIGSLLSIKPIIEVRDGAIEGESRQRTRARSLHYLVERVAAAGPLTRAAVVHAAAADIEVFLDLLGPAVAGTDVIVTSIGPVVGAHTGLGTIGVCWLLERS